MTILELVLCALLVLVGSLALAAHQRYRALRRKHKALQRLYEKAEQQLRTLWTSKNQ